MGNNRAPDDEFERYKQAPGPEGRTPAEVAKWFHTHRLFVMRELFREYCVSPASATTVERVWSDAGNLVTKKRRGKGGEGVGEGGGRVRWDGGRGGRR